LMTDLLPPEFPVALIGPAVALAAAMGVLVLLAFIKQFLIICRPQEVLILAGRQHRREDGSTAGYRVVFGGRALRIPIIETVDRMDMRSIPIDVQIQGAYTRVGIPLKVRAIALVKISSSPQVIMNAVERFLGRGHDDVQRVAKETLEGNLRGVLATLTPEEVNEDRLKFAESLAQEVEHDLAKLGLHLDVLKIQHVTDDANYLDSIGRGQIAQVIQEAEIAESNARNEAAKEAAAAEMRAKVAEAEAEQRIVQRRNELRRVQAELEAAAKSIEERAEGGALAAEATARQALEGVRRELAAVQLQSDVVIPAEIQREAAAHASAGTAARIAEDGRATAESLSLVSDAWLKAGASAPDLFIFNKIEELTQIVVEGVKRLEVKNIQLVDSDGSSLPRLAAAYPAAVAEVLRSLFATTGVDLNDLIARGQRREGVPPNGAIPPPSLGGKTTADTSGVA
ncbi:MAG TPA: SPFH domain-containing protein, partial [Polyangia bacterium]